MKSQVQIHGRSSFDRVPGIAAPRPAMTIQFHGPVCYENIRGRYHFSVQLEAPAIVWGRDGRCWAFLHDDCRQAAADRRGVSARAFGR